MKKIKEIHYQQSNGILRATEWTQEKENEIEKDKEDGSIIDWYIIYVNTREDGTKFYSYD